MSLEKSNAGGMMIFAISMVVVLPFFIYVIIKNPGPLDKKEPTLAGSYTHEEQSQRLKEWHATSPEAVERGKNLYVINCAGCHSGQGDDVVLKNAKAGTFKQGTSAADIYNTIVHGVPGSMARMDYFAKKERWDLVHFISSQLPNVPEVKKETWDHITTEELSGRL